MLACLSSSYRWCRSVDRDGVWWTLMVSGVRCAYPAWSFSTHINMFTITNIVYMVICVRSARNKWLCSFKVNSFFRATDSKNHFSHRRSLCSLRDQINLKYYGAVMWSAVAELHGVKWKSLQQIYIKQLEQTPLVQRFLVMYRHFSRDGTCSNSWKEQYDRQKKNAIFTLKSLMLNRGP